MSSAETRSPLTSVRDWLRRQPFVLESLLLGLLQGGVTWALLAWWGTIERTIDTALDLIIWVTLTMGPFQTWLHRRRTASE